MINNTISKPTLQQTLDRMRIVIIILVAIIIVMIWKYGIAFPPESKEQRTLYGIIIGTIAAVIYSIWNLSKIKNNSNNSK
ncbi:hypothetical protein H6503_06855 [Candidatus Woesearchaeota archaeon]|nr:hypothetical protein [Candidatus Woesearchaeota archaeon]